ncbi:hypothetical protein [Spiroplasma endosymbiont of Polydrusus pterygomalis]|uniref:hypothetical protein n=1 Tax=Spiroplasma endosymbiont of Polydrusus pterygomalis TaxID=3139327 RepID=UPI003CCB081A
MHKVFYLNNNFTTMEEINLMFDDGLKIKEYLNKHHLQCGFSLECKAILEAVMFKVTKAVYLRTQKGERHVLNCSYYYLVKLREKILKYGSLEFLFKKFSKKRKISKKITNSNHNNSNELISGNNIPLDDKSLSKIYYLFKNDKENEFDKNIFIDNDNCEEWYKNNSEVKDNIVLLTGYLNKKLISCNNKDCKNNGKNYDCRVSPQHDVEDYKLEIILKKYKFHISVSKEIYVSIEDNEYGEYFNNINWKPKKYHILAKINKSSRTELFYTKHKRNKLENHVLYNKKSVEEIIE